MQENTPSRKRSHIPPGENENNLQKYLEKGICDRSQEGILYIQLLNWVVVLNICYFHPYLEKISILTNIFQMGWNHQLDNLFVFQKIHGSLEGWFQGRLNDDITLVTKSWGCNCQAMRVW